MDATGYDRDLTDTEVADTYWPGGLPDGYRAGWFDALADGYELDWALADDDKTRCRFTVGPGHRTCGRPAVVTLRRGKSARWGYCDLTEHLYRRRYDPGPPPRLWTARLYSATGEVVA